MRAVRSGADKALLARYDYLPYGESRVAAGMALNKGFTGHTWDPALKQYHAPFRYYSPSAARWNMRDPLGYVDGPNLYGYVGGRPSSDVDTLGLIPCVPPLDPLAENPVRDAIKNALDDILNTLNIIVSGMFKWQDPGDLPEYRPLKDMRKLSPKEVKKIEDDLDEDVHKLKESYVGEKNISKFDLYRSKDGGVWIGKKDGSGEGINCGIKFQK